MIKLLCLILRLACEVDTELFEYVFIYAGEQHGGMCLCAGKLGKLFERACGGFIGCRRNSERKKRFIHMQARVAVAHMIGLELLDRFDDRGRDEQRGIVDACEIFEGIQKHRGAGAEELGGLTRDDLAVGKLDCNGRSVCFGSFRKCGKHGGTHFLVDAELAHDELDLLYFGFIAKALAYRANGGIIAADDLLIGRLLCAFVIKNAVACHIDAHIRGALVGRFAVDLFKHDLQNGEDLNISVVVDGGEAVSIEMIRVDHIDVAHIGGRRLVCEVDGMRQRDIPDREGLEFCVTRADASLMLMIQLGKTSCHLAAAGAGRCDDDELSCGFDIFIFAEALFADDVRDIVRIIFDGVMAIDLDAEIFQTLLEDLRGMLLAVLCDDDAADVKTDAAEYVDEAERIEIVGDAKVAAALILFDVACGDDDHDLCAIAKLIEHLDLAVGLEAGEYAGRVKVIEKLAAEFEVKLTAEGGDSVQNFLRLQGNILVVIKTNGIHKTLPFIKTKTCPFLRIGRSTPVHHNIIAQREIFFQYLTENFFFYFRKAIGFFPSEGQLLTK